MKRALLGFFAGAALFALGSMASMPAEAADTYKLDKTHASILFKVDHFGFSDVWGRFNDFDATLTLDQENPENSSISLTIQTISLDTNHLARDNHLRGPDFFNVREHGTITFESTSIDKTGEKTAKVTGDLTMLGVTKEVTLDARVNKVGPYPFDETIEIAGFAATTTIDRGAFGMSFGEGGIGMNIPVHMSMEFRRKVE